MSERKRPEESEAASIRAPQAMDCCPVCGTRLTGCGVWNPILGELCSTRCLDIYWKGSDVL